MHVTRLPRVLHVRTVGLGVTSPHVHTPAVGFSSAKHNVCAVVEGDAASKGKASHSHFQQIRLAADFDDRYVFHDIYSTTFDLVRA